MTTETVNDLGPQCPYCGGVHQADDPHFYTDDRVTFMCGWCEKDFTYTYHRRDSWHSQPLPK